MAPLGEPLPSRSDDVAPVGEALPSRSDDVAPVGETLPARSDDVDPLRETILEATGARALLRERTSKPAQHRSPGKVERVEPYPGAEIGAYRLDAKVGEGAYGAVWSGTHTESGERAALKMLLPTAATSAEHVSRFHREADLLALVKSRNVARMIDFRVDPHFGVVLVMELVIGERLSEVLDRGPMSVALVIELGVQLLAGARDLHAQGVIHRDLKPHNIMLARDTSDGSRRVVIVDLGLGRLVQSAKARSPAQPSLTPSFVVLGTLACIAPEQIVNARGVSPRADLYAIGSILHRAWTGRYPFEADDKRSVAEEKLTSEAPPFCEDAQGAAAVGLRDVVAKSIRRHPSERYESAEAMMAALQALEAHSARGARSVADDSRQDAVDDAPTGRERSRLVPRLAMGLVLTASMAFAWWAFHR